MEKRHLQQSLAIGPSVCVLVDGARTLTASRLGLRFRGVISGRLTSGHRSSACVTGFYASLQISVYKLYYIHELHVANLSRILPFSLFK